MEVVPKDAFDDGIRFPSLEEDIELSDAAIRARRAMRKENKEAKPVRFKRDDVINSVFNIFREIGGDPRMTEWADKNPGEFYKGIYAKMLTPAVNHMQVNASGPVQINCSLPRSALDDSPELAPDGLALPDSTPTE